MTAVEFRDVSKAYGQRSILGGISFAVPSETFAVFMGPPGCGKSVLLRLLTGLEQPSGGKIFMRGEDVTRVSAAERNIGYVPQSFALYPHYRVYDNIAYPLKLAGASKQETDAVVRRVAGMLRIDHLLKKKPNSFEGLMLAGQVALLEKKPKEALAWFEKARKQKPDSALAAARDRKSVV